MTCNCEDSTQQCDECWPPGTLSDLEGDLLHANHTVISLEKKRANVFVKLQELERELSCVDSELRRARDIAIKLAHERLMAKLLDKR